MPDKGKKRENQCSEHKKLFTAGSKILCLKTRIAVNPGNVIIDIPVSEMKDVTIQGFKFSINNQSLVNSPLPSG
jgi:hypothetical protein